MDEGEIRGGINSPDKPLFRADFPDESVFNLPKQWEAVFVDYFGTNKDNYPMISDQLALIAGKYREHHAYPNQYDDYIHDKSMGRYDNPEYYSQKIEIEPDEATRLKMEEQEDAASKRAQQWKRERREEIIILKKEPTMAEMADRLLYIAMRPGLIQKAMLEDAESRGDRPSLVVTPKQALEETQGDKPHEETGRLVTLESPLLRHLAPYMYRK